MKKQVKYLSFIFAAAVCISLTACGGLSKEEPNDSVSSESTDSSDNTNTGSSGNTDNTDRSSYETDAYGTVERDGEQTDVCVCHDQEAIYLYFNNEKNELFDTATLPTDEIYDDDKDWCIGKISLDDINGDNNSDLQVYLSHADMSESYIVWEWDKDKGFTYQPDDSRFYENRVIRDPIDEAEDKIGIFDGFWLAEAPNEFDYLEFDEAGNWTLYLEEEVLDEGFIWYDTEQDVICFNSFSASSLDGGQVTFDGEWLCVTTCGRFEYVGSTKDNGYSDNESWDEDDDRDFGGNFID